ncbi:MULTISPECIES: HNH endonuclease [Bacillus cereus group]|uniref:HNH endonuclease n=1 Tax=Bacillus cereus group TaxID=86661 RepID=UPI0022E16EA0|nr:HNH endonuclease signature motif containing protein [Bacillus cereus group sp. Bc015]MDA2738621.1 HNH endonuclease signature motif containing protein [Bacillus cereus group sp. Bc015]
MAIPKAIESQHVLEAIKKIDKIGVESFNPSTAYELMYKENYYPPKEVLHLASLMATGHEIRRLSGGDETNNALIKLGFKIVLKGTKFEIEKNHVKKQREKNNGNTDKKKNISINENELLFIKKKEIEVTEREQIIKSRIGQISYKKGLLEIYGKCILCGISDERFLIASHIKPWSQSNDDERLDLNNGLLLCPNHDALFDRGYISFTADGRIMISDSLNVNTKLFLNINEKLKIEMNVNQKQYMKWHRENRYSN